VSDLLLCSDIAVKSHRKDHLRYRQKVVLIVNLIFIEFLIVRPKYNEMRCLGLEIGLKAVPVLIGLNSRTLLYYNIYKLIQDLA